MEKTDNRGSASGMMDSASLSERLRGEKGSRRSPMKGMKACIEMMSAAAFLVVAFRPHIGSLSCDEVYDAAGQRDERCSESSRKGEPHEAFERARGAEECEEVSQVSQESERARTPRSTDKRPAELSNRGPR